MYYLCSMFVMLIPSPVSSYNQSWHYFTSWMDRWINGNNFCGVSTYYCFSSITYQYVNLFLSLWGVVATLAFQLPFLTGYADIIPVVHDVCAIDNNPLSQFNPGLWGWNVAGPWDSGCYWQSIFFNLQYYPLTLGFFFHNVHNLLHDKMP